MTDTEDKITERKAFQTKVLKKFMTEEEMNQFFGKYDSNRRAHGYHGSRKVSLAKPTNRLEREALKFYLFDDRTLRKLSSDLGYTDHSHFDVLARSAAMKILYQNREKFKLDELLNQK